MKMCEEFIFFLDKQKACRDFCIHPLAPSLRARKGDTFTGIADFFINPLGFVHKRKICDFI